MASSELTGGAGFTYEDGVAANYLVSMLIGVTASGLDNRIVRKVAQQQAEFGEPLDDVIVDAVSMADESAMRLSLQVKRTLTISDAASNSDFRDVIRGSWQTLQKTDFRENIDRVGAVTESVAEERLRAFRSVCEWARASDQTVVFTERFAESGNASATHRSVFNAVRTVADSTGVGLSDDQLHLLFKHLVLIRLDFLHVESTHGAEAVANLQRSVVQEQVGRAGDLWDLLRQIARDGAGCSAVHTRASLVRALPGWRFKGAPAFGRDMQTLRDSTRHWLDQQAVDIGGRHLVRQTLRDKLRTQMADHRLTLIKGLPGTGKTVLLHHLVQELATDGTTLLLTANRLSGRSWSAHARTMGLETTSIEPLLVEVAATGHAMILIDGLDRIDPEQRAILSDLLGQLLTNPVLTEWSAVATVRDTGIEPLRTWLPTALLSHNGVGYVDVENFSDEEARSLAGFLPALRPLLTGGNDGARAVARRPFFAAVLARGFSRAAYVPDFAPQSEVELVDAWWEGGGYNAHAPQVLTRQRGLIELAQRSAPDLGRNVNIRDLSPATQNVLPSLMEDGLVKQMRTGHTVEFSHDIFFEWSFLHLLLDQGDQWIATLSEVGEPPALARVVELMSQVTYALPDQWPCVLHSLGQAQIRPQWLRAWLLAPVFSPRFAEHADMFAASLAADGHRLLGKLLVWMQAEKTTPNPRVLSGLLGGDLDAATRIRIADSLGWPSDPAAWGRLIIWAIEQVEKIPDDQFQDLFTLFETWQNAFANYPNPVSQMIVDRCAVWLQAIEDEHLKLRCSYDTSAVNATTYPHVPTQLETELRALVIGAARAYPDVVNAYLTKVESIESWSGSAFGELISFAPLLAETHPALLVRIAKVYFMRELPDDTSARWRREANEERHQLMIANSFSNHHWDGLSIGDNHHSFFPVSPCREPFNSLLTKSLPTALSLICDLTNHATTAWLQLHHYWPRRGTPLPLEIEFPWGRQQFWGEDNHYLWFRGHGGPQVVECALMTLERWAIAQLDSGRLLDDLLQELLDGHTSIAILGIAVHLSLRGEHVSLTTLALLRSTRLWRLDLWRQRQERSLQLAGRMGFNNTTDDLMHHKAVTKSNQITSRRLGLRNLVPVFLFSGNMLLCEECRSALDNLPNNLEFTYQEDAQNSQLVSIFRRDAELWSEYGHAENYKSSPVSGRDDVLEISMSTSPRHDDPDVQAILQRALQTERESELWVWVDKCFSSRQWAPGFSVDEAVGRARELASADAARKRISAMPRRDFVDSAIAGTAAAVICFSDAIEHQGWADTTIDKFLSVGEDSSGDLFGDPAADWHPKIYASYSLAWRIKSGRDRSSERLELFRLIMHPDDKISLAALSMVAECWEHDARYSWCGLNLGLRLAQLVRRRMAFQLGNEEYRQMELNNRDTVMTAAYEEYLSHGLFPSLVIPKPSWVQVSPQEESISCPGQNDEEEWQISDDLWDSKYAASVLQRFPVVAVMASTCRTLFVNATESFIHWTLDTINPPRRTDRSHRHELPETHLYEWLSQLGWTVASVAAHLPADESMQKLLRPILAQPDVIAIRLLTPFTQSLVCDAVFDAQEIRDETLQLLHAVLERTLETRELIRSPHNDGRMCGSDLQDLIKSLLFIVVDNAPNSTRFANGNWKEIARVMPLVDHFVRTAGWHTFVAHSFILLCQSCGAAYPTEIFADQIIAQLVDGCLPSAWSHTIIPAAIAGLVQTHAERQHPLPSTLGRKLLQVLDALVDLGDRRSAAMQQSEAFRGIRNVV